MTIDWNAILIALTGSGGLVGVIALFKKVLRLFRRTQVFHSIDNTSEAYGVLNDLLIRLGASRVLVLRLENGGGIPSPDKRLFSSVLHEIYTIDLAPVREAWQKRQVDAGYVEMMAKVYRSGGLATEVSGLPKGSVLRDRYEMDGIKNSEVRALGITKDAGAFLYLTVNWRVENRPHARGEAVQREVLRESVQDLRRLLAVSMPQTPLDRGAN